MSTAIADIRIHAISVPLERAFWMSVEPYTVAAEIVVEVETEAGHVGIGEIHGRPQSAIIAILQHFRSRLVGEDALDHERLYDVMFRSTFTRTAAGFEAADGQPHFGAGAKPQFMAAIAGIDIALWDIKGKAAGLPLWKLLGGRRSAVPAYASGGYYGPDGQAYVDELVAEMAGYAALGFDGVKLKVGGLSIAEDVARVACSAPSASGHGDHARRQLGLRRADRNRGGSCLRALRDPLARGARRLVRPGLRARTGGRPDEHPARKRRARAPSLRVPRSRRPHADPLPPVRLHACGRHHRVAPRGGVRLCITGC